MQRSPAAAGRALTPLSTSDLSRKYHCRIDINSIFERSPFNNAGDLVGISVTGQTSSRAFLYSGGAMHDLGEGVAYDINDLGQEVGSTTWFERGHALLFAAGQALDLNTMVTGIDGWTLTDARGINEAGQIFGTACNGVLDSCREVLLNPIAAVPEPATWAMLLAGLAGIVGRRRAGRRMRA